MTHSFHQGGKVTGEGLANTVRQTFRIVPIRRLYWGLLIALAIFVSVLEMAGALIVYILLELVVDPEAPIELPLIGDLRQLFPGVESSNLLMGVIIGMAAFTLIRAIVKVGSKYAQYRVAHNAGARLSITLVRGYLGLPYAAHLQRNSAELIRNSREAVNQMVTGVLLPVIKVVAETMIMIGLLVILTVINPIGTAIAVVFVGLAAVVLLAIVQPRIKRVGQTAHRHHKRTYKALQQALHGIRDIKILGRESFFANEFGRSQIKLARAHYLRSTATAFPSVVMEAVIIGLILLLFGLAVITGSQSQTIVSTLGLFAYAGLRLQPSMQQIIKGLNDIRHATAPLDDISKDLHEITSSKQGEVSQSRFETLDLKEAVHFEDVSFTYEGAPEPAIKEVDLTIHAGEQIGICGPTGGGKTTLVDLLTGLLQPTTGRVTVDGYDIAAHTRGWHRSLGVVPQMVFLTDDTLRRNIALGVSDRDIDHQALEEAIELAQLRDFVESLPQGLDTNVGERGVRISGGQRQRIAIARALYRRPTVVIFDEGTSALDSATESNVMAAIDRLRGQRTVVLIAHRLASVKNADRVVFVDKGVIAGVDTFDALERDNEHFRLLTSSS